MGSPCNYTVYIGKQMHAKCRLPEDAAMLCVQHPGAIVKYNGRIVWRGVQEHMPCDLGRARIVIAQRRAQHWDERQARISPCKTPAGNGASRPAQWHLEKQEQAHGKE